MEQARKHADAVFAGKVIAAEQFRITFKEGPPAFDVPIYVMRYTLQVEREFKGRMVADQVIVYTGMGNGDCGFQFKLNERYIVYGDRDDVRADRYMADKQLYGRGIYWTGICTRTRLYDEEEVKQLE